MLRKPRSSCSFVKSSLTATLASSCSSSSSSESSHESNTFFFVFSLDPPDDAVPTEVRPVSAVAVEVTVLSVSVVESVVKLSSSALLASSPSPTMSKRLRSDSGSLRKFAKLAVMVARTREKSEFICQLVVSRFDNGRYFDR